jgi:hypothetical protein
MWSMTRIDAGAFIDSSFRSAGASLMAWVSIKLVKAVRAWREYPTLSRQDCERMGPHFCGVPLGGWWGWELGGGGGAGDLEFFGGHVDGDVGEEWGAEVAFAGVGQHAEDS